MNDLTKGDVILYEGHPVRILSVSHTKTGRQGATATLKIKNLRTGGTLERTARPADRFEEVNLTKQRMRYEFSHRGAATFVDPNNPSNRLSIEKEQLHDVLPYLPEQTKATLLFFDDELIDVTIPPKVDLRVTMAPPAIKGNTADGGTKQVETETGLTVATPLFIETGDVIKINTETGEYVERVEKA